MKIAFSPEAERDLSVALDFLLARRPASAADLLANVRSLVRQLADREIEGPQVRLRSGELVRSWPIPPFRLYYRRGNDTLHVLRIYHQARRPITR